jgi:hypothetical protein
MKFRNVLGAVGLIAVLGAAGVARADVVLWIDDANNNIGTVDITNHTGTYIGNAGRDTLTDIAFTSNGNLYGVSFDSTYQINTTNGHVTFLANTPSNGMNALVGTGATGLYGASNDTTSLYSFNTTNNHWSTLSGSTGGQSAGDIAPGGGNVYYESESDGNADALYKITVNGSSISSNFVGEFNLNGHTFGLDSVFGLADNGSTMYAVDGTDIYSVNLNNGDLTFLMDYSGKACTGSGWDQTCLGAANGTAFLNEAGGVPEPATWGLLIVGVGLIGSQLRRRPAVAGAVA